MSSGLQWNIHRFSKTHSLHNWSVIQKLLSIDKERVSPSPLTPRNCHSLQRVEILTYFITPTHCCQDVSYICETVIADFYFEHIITQWFGSGYRSSYILQFSYHDKIKCFEVQVNMSHLFSFIFFSWTQTGAFISGDTTSLKCTREFFFLSNSL